MSVTIGAGAPAHKPHSGWSAAAKAAFTGTLQRYPALDGPGLAALVQACTLITRADKYERRIDLDGPVSLGSQGQPVAHPLVPVAIQCRTGAATILDRLTGGPARRQRAGLRQNHH